MAEGMLVWLLAWRLDVGPLMDESKYILLVATPSVPLESSETFASSVNLLEYLQSP